MQQAAELSMDSYQLQRLEHGCHFQDPIYGRAQLGPLALEFLDTEPVQRLRHLKQLGCASYAFPTAEHSRFVHSVGVGHLAGQCVLSLGATGLHVKREFGELLEVAGLCHDLGHGPFSHVFEGEFLPAVLGALGKHHWSHEAMSAQLLQYTVDTYNIDLDQQQIRRLQDIISSGGKLPQQLVWEEEDAWLLQIVANAVNGIDVDKLDYLMRDAEMTGAPHTNDLTHLMLRNCRVIDGVICFHEADASAAYSVYHTRAMMHADVYQHKKSKAAEYMIVDVLKAADPVLGISDRIHSPEDFLSLDDSLVREISRAARRDPSEPRLQEAAAILRRLERRDLYEFVAEAVVPVEALKGYVDVTVADVLAHQDHNSGVMLVQGDVLVHNMKIDWCKGLEDPLKYVMLYSNDGSVRSAVGASVPKPATFIIRRVRVFLRRHCPDIVQKQQYMAATQTAFTRAMQKRFGQDVQIQTSSGSGRASKRAAANLQQQQQQYGSQLQRQQQLLHAGSGNSSGSLAGHQVAMQDVLPLRTDIVQAWNLQQQQQQQRVSAAVAAVAGRSSSSPEFGEFVPATDDEEDEDYAVDDDATVDEDMTYTQFSTQSVQQGTDVSMQQ